MAMAGPTSFERLFAVLPVFAIVDDCEEIVEEKGRV
jgi:hypothetical protein